MTIMDYDFGFPIVIHDVEVVNINGTQVFNIDYVSLHNEVLKALVKKPTRLTGDEVHFIRLALELNLSDFGKLLDVTHAAVIAWESKGDSPTLMGLGTEILIRLHALRKLDCSDVGEILDVINHIPSESIELEIQPMQFSALTVENAWVTWESHVVDFAEPKANELDPRCDEPLATAA
jgi:DNA-binding transcriptional regulator YiaG